MPWVVGKRKILLQAGEAGWEWIGFPDSLVTLGVLSQLWSV